MNGDLVRLARDLRGMSQARLSKESGLSTATLCRIERGDRDLSPDEVRDVGRVLAMPGAFFHSSCMHAGALGAVRFRRKSTASAGSRRRAIALLNLASYLANELSEMNGVPDPYLPFQSARLRDFADSPERAAHQLRAAWQLPDGPIRNLTEVAEAAGVSVFSADLGEEIMGLSQWPLDSQPVILVNRGMPGDRVRWTLAHELSHLLLHVRHRDPDSMECEADATAAELLMPRADIDSSLRALSVTKLRELKHEWGVAMSALVRRARDLGRISEHQAKSFYIMFAKRGWRKSEPEQVPIENTNLVPLLRRRIVDDCGGVVEAAAALRIGESEFDLLLPEAAGRAHAHLRLLAE